MTTYKIRFIDSHGKKSTTTEDFNNEEDLAILREIMGHKLYEAYTEFPKEVTEIPDSKIQDLFKIIKKLFKTSFSHPKFD